MTSHQRDAGTLHICQGMLCFGLLIGPIIPLGIGAVFICLGAVVAEEWLVPGLAILVAGAAFVGATLVGVHRFAVFFLPEEAPSLALFVAVEFSAGALLAFIGLGNMVFDVQDFSGSLVPVAALGLLLVSDSLILYRSGFRQNAGKRKGA